MLARTTNAGWPYLYAVCRTGSSVGLFIRALSAELVSVDLRPNSTKLGRDVDQSNYCEGVRNSISL